MAAENESLEEMAAKFITVSEACELSGFTPSYIRRLLREGTIKGVKMGRDWYTTESALQEYLKQDRRPGPKSE